MMCLRDNWSVFKFVLKCACVCLSPTCVRLSVTPESLGDNKESSLMKRKQEQKRELVLPC